MKLSDRWIKTRMEVFVSSLRMEPRFYGHYAACRPLVEGFDTMSGVAQVRGTG